MEIKFRGKTQNIFAPRNDNEWVYGYYKYDSYHDLHLISVFEKEKEFLLNGLGYGGTFIDYKVAPETVGQFTGQKNIYDGDGGVHPVFGAYYVALGEYDHNMKQEIGFYIKWKIEYHRRKLRKDLGFWINEGLLFDMNIHDNPELLEAK